MFMFLVEYIYVLIFKDNSERLELMVIYFETDVNKMTE